MSQFIIKDIKQLTTSKLHNMIASVPVIYPLSWVPASWDTNYSNLPYSCNFVLPYVNQWDNPLSYNLQQGSPYFYLTSQNMIQSVESYLASQNMIQSLDSYGSLMIFTVSGEYDINISVTDVTCVMVCSHVYCDDPSCPKVTDIQPPTLSLYLNGVLVARNQSLTLNYTNTYNIGDYITMSIMNNDSYSTINNITGNMNIVVKNP